MTLNLVARLRHFVFGQFRRLFPAIRPVILRAVFQQLDDQRQLRRHAVGVLEPVLQNGDRFAHAVGENFLIQMTEGNPRLIFSTLAKGLFQSLLVFPFVEIGFQGSALLRRDIFFQMIGQGARGSSAICAPFAISGNP